MAQKQLSDTSESEKPRGKIFSKRRFTLLISLLIAIILLLCTIIIVLTTLDITYNNRNLNYNETIQESNNLYKFQNNVEQSQIHEMIYRDKWGGRPALYERPQRVPVKYVIISHTAGAECFTISSCSKQIVQIQRMHVSSGSPDVGYNFLIGGDANIYVARGWDNHNFHMNLDTIGICFVGDYMYHVLTPDMIEATQQLLKMGIEGGKLDKDYILVAHNQTYNTVSPGPNVYKQIKFWPHYSPEILSDTDK